MGAGSSGDCHSPLSIVVTGGNVLGSFGRRGRPNAWFRDLRPVKAPSEPIGPNTPRTPSPAPRVRSVKKSTQQIRVLIADDHVIFRDGLHRLLEENEAFTVVGEASNGADAVKRVAELSPDILLLDLAMPTMDGLQALQELRDLGSPVRSILLTAAIDPDETVKALQLGARGVILKQSETHLLYKCLHEVMKDQLWVGHERVKDIVHHLRAALREPGSPPPASRLTKRELQIIAAIVDGAGNKDIGRQLGLSEQTVKNHLTHIFDKVGVSSRLELALYAVYHKLAPRAMD